MKRCVWIVVALLAPACSDGGGDETVRVFAAASLTDAFQDIEAAFEAAEPGVDIVLNVAGSSTLRAQLDEGAPADVFAPASAEHAEGLGREAVVFATNSLVLAVPAGNPGGVAGLGDVARRDLLVGLCAPDVPCGALAAQVLDDAGVEASVDTEEPDVRALLTKVVAGELDAGLVYRTDALAAGDTVESIPIGGPVAEYPIVALTDAGDTFVDFVLGADGQRILDTHGFGEP